MYRLIFFTAQLVLLIAILTLTFSNPFKISLDIGDFKYSFSSSFFVAVATIILLFIYLSLLLYFKSKVSFNNYLIKSKYKKLDKGYNHFVEAMIAIANKDNRTAIKSHRKMNSYLKDDPSLSLLLKSEVYKIEKDYNKLSEVYEIMIKSKKTEVLGYRGLMQQNLKQQDYHHAFLYGEKLFNINPYIDQLYETLIFVAAKTKNWNQLILLSEKAHNKNIINRDTLYENKSISHYEIARILNDSNLKESTKNIVKALELKKFFPPFVKLHLELVSRSNNLLLLKKLIKKYWSASPTSVVRGIISQIIIDNNLGNISFINQIIKNNSQNEESKKLLISFAIKNQEWNIARINIEGLIGANPTGEICLFMANIEMGENNDKQKSDSWIMRSENSIVENMWICKITSQSQPEWTSLSDSGYFNSLVLNNLKMVSSNNN